MLNPEQDGKMAKAGLIKKQKQRKCTICKGLYAPTRPLQTGCGYECDLIIAIKAATKAKEKRERDEKKKVVEYNRETVRMKKAHREGDKKWQAKKTKTLCHQFIRMRDAADGCISCGTKEAKKYDAGHYIPSHRGGLVRYSELNIHKQCSACNDGNKLSGNLTLYRIQLQKKIGTQALENLELTGHQVKRWTIEELVELQVYYKKKIMEIETGQE